MNHIKNQIHYFIDKKGLYPEEYEFRIIVPRLNEEIPRYVYTTQYRNYTCKIYYYNSHYYSSLEPMVIASPIVEKTGWATFVPPYYIGESNES